MSLLLVMLLAQADARYVGGAPPHPLGQVGPVDERPSVIACTVTTLRERTRCVLDGRPTVTGTSPTRQAADNQKLAGTLGEALCRERAELMDAEAPEQGAAFRACLSRVKQAVKSCGLDGVESLLDATGLFSPHAQACYAGLAAASQLVGVPAAPAPAPSSPVTPTRSGVQEL